MDEFIKISQDRKYLGMLSFLNDHIVFCCINYLSATKDQIDQIIVGMVHADTPFTTDRYYVALIQTSHLHYAKNMFIQKCVNNNY